MTTKQDQVLNAQDYLTQNADGTVTVNGTGTELDGLIIDSSGNVYNSDGSQYDGDVVITDNGDGTYTANNVDGAPGGSFDFRL